ncbi:MAG: peptidase MA family metallohydrolase [Symbiobacteriia bacterium]
MALPRSRLRLLTAAAVAVVLALAILSFGWTVGYGATNRTIQAVRGVAAARVEAVLQHDRPAFLATVDAANATYATEQGHWFDDAARTVASYALTVRDLRLTARDTAQVDLTESFTLQNGERRGRNYTAVFKLRPGGWTDSDYAFTELRQDRVTVRHWNRPRAAALALAAEAENVAWLQQTFGWQPAAAVVIKLYPEREPFLYSIKPSLPGWVAGWTEAGESIKYWVMQDAPSSEGLLHETTHHMLSELTNDNASYWLQEGLATWATATHGGGLDVRSQLGPSGRLPWTLPELAAVNLEELDQNKAEAYYAEAYLTVKYLLDTYGMEKLKAVTAELARHPANPVTASEKLTESSTLTQEAISNVLGVPFEQFAGDWQTWAAAQLIK